MDQFPQKRCGNTYIGAPIERVEDVRFLRGRGEYVDDVRRDGQWHAAIFRSAVAHARIRSIEASAALALPGVRAVVTANDIGHPLPQIPVRVPRASEHRAFRYQQPVIAADVVRYVGEPVALVLADTPEIAEDALDGIVLDAEPLPIVTDPQNDSALLFPEIGSNCALLYDVSRGDTDEAFRKADYVCRREFSVQRQTALPMETRGVLADWDASTEKLTLYGAAKVPFQNRKALAAMLGIGEDRVDLIECDVGGGFGVRGDFYPEDFLVAFAALRFKRAVKWIEDRREHLVSVNHARDVTCSIELACSCDGTILGLRGETTVDIGAYARPSITNTVRIVAQFLSGPYRIPGIRLQSRGFVSNKTPCGVFRGPGRFESAFFYERIIDIAANDLGIDRLEMRRRNLIALDEMPWQHAAVAPYGAGEYDSGDYRETLDRCLREFRWDEKQALDGRLIDGRHHGMAVGCYIEGGASGPHESARLVVEADGRVAVYIGSSSVGQGIETIFAQIAADALELPMTRISG
ncbi:MAG TPA: xanthine dehydrogenase family protein molybdopterin-binding subunit, partial [Gemmatimonadaceae bacterium]|nr:xanthine dehydrogenase family protein molybdopterin-binding subunit [Gemmatimonadaceae bacterium]